MYDIIVIGSATRDVFLRPDKTELRQHDDSPTGLEQCFPLGEKIEIKEIVLTTGGGGDNAVVTFGRQGFKSAYVGVVGKDAAGDDIIAELKRENVDSDFVSRHEDGLTAYSTILMFPNGERTILSYNGEGQHFNSAVIPFEKLETKWMYLDSMGGHYDVLEEAVNHAVKNGIKIASNPGGKELAHGLEKLKPLLQHIDIFSCNKEEGAGLVGTKPEEQEETLRRLAALCKDVVILTDGHSGVKVLADSVLYSAGVPDSLVVERTGAGDAFASGFVSEYIRGGDIKKAIQFGTANASSVVTQIGSKAGILKLSDWGPWPLIEVQAVEFK